MPLATALAAFALLAGALVFAPIGSTRSGIPTLSPTPPVYLPPAPSTPTTATTTPTTPAPTPARPVLPKTGVDAELVAFVGLAMMLGGAALRRVVATAPARRRR